MHPPRARLRPSLAVFAAAVALSAAFTFTRPRVYEATARLGLVPSRFMDVNPTEASLVRSSVVELNTFVAVARSKLLAGKVEARLADRDRQRLLGAQVAGTTLVDALRRGLRVSAPPAAPGALHLSFRHRDRLLTGTLANLYADEMREWLLRTQIDASLRSLEDLDRRIDEQRRRVNATARTIAERRESERPPSDGAALSALTLRLEEEQTLLVQLLARKQETAAALARDRSPDYPLLPATPPVPGDYIAPNHARDLGLGALLGLLAARLAFRLRALPCARHPGRA
jgi:uncharacterized protein involved in exopolysaccharide biosynthesis